MKDCPCKVPELPVTATISEQLEVSVEKIIDSVATSEGARLYQVRWMDSWVAEHYLVPNCQHLISAYWHLIERELQQTMQSEQPSKDSSDRVQHPACVEVNNTDNGEDLCSMSSDQCMQDQIGNNGVPILGECENRSSNLTSSEHEDSVSLLCGSVLTHQNKMEVKQQVECERNYKEHISETQSHVTSAEVEQTTSHTKQTKRLECLHCGKVLSSKKVLKRHMVLKHFKNGQYQCLVCKRRFFSSHELRRHMPVHTNVKAYSCEICGKSFKQSAHLLRHARIHDGLKPYQCNICGKKFSQKENLLNHQPTHGQERLFKCSLCSASFKHRNSIYSHVRRSHSSNREEVCSFCGAEFCTKTLLRKHVKCHHSETLFQCPHCPSKYKNRTFLKKHIARHDGSIVIKKLDLKSLHRKD